MTRVKICGIKSVEEALAASEAGADAVGFVFAKSPRRVDTAKAAEICRVLPPFVSRVGVFVNEKRDVVKDIASSCGLTVLQFHGSEDGEYCGGFSLPVLKAVRIRSRSDLSGMLKVPAAGYVLDSYLTGMAGGTGITFEWQLIEGIPTEKVILAGGLSAGNVAGAIKKVKPHGVDVSSGVEKDGMKDPLLIKEFMSAVRGAA